MDWDAYDRDMRRQEWTDRMRWAGEMVGKNVVGMIGLTLIGFFGAVGASFGWEMGRAYQPMYVSTDKKTGCEYLIVGGAMVPRLDRQGHIVCALDRDHGDITQGPAP